MRDGPANRPAEKAVFPASQHEGEVVVRPLRSRADRSRFLRFPWRVYAGDPVWVPPLLHDLRTVLAPSHPFHAHADVACFIALRGNEVVGRIAGIVNRAHVEFHEEHAGFFGLFESLNDPTVAAALLGTVEEWLCSRGMEIVRGPFNLSTNDELWSPGVLIDGFHRPPVVLMGHTPPWYADLLESAGYAKSKDLLAYWIADNVKPAERLARSIDRIQERSGIRIRSLDMRRLDAEVALIQEIYNAAWEKNWGFVPMSGAEITHLAKQLKPVVNPDLCVIALAEDEPVAFGLALPDFNQALRHMNGRLFPFGLIKLLWYRRRIDAARVLTLGIRQGYRNRGLDAMINLHLFRRGAEVGLNRGECSWILEDNWEMRRGLERLGAVADKTYRVFEKHLAR